MTDKNVYKLDEIVEKYSSMCLRTATKMKPVDFESDTYIDFDVENNDEDPNFEVGDHVRISYLAALEATYICHFYY